MNEDLSDLKNIVKSIKLEMQKLSIETSKCDITINDLMQKSDALMSSLDGLGLKYEKDTDDPDFWGSEPELNVFIFGHKVDYNLMVALTTIGKEIYSENNLFILIDYAPNHENDLGEIVRKTSNNYARLGADYKLDDVYSYLSNFLKPSDILSTDKLLITPAKLKELFPPKYQTEDGAVEDMKERARLRQLSNKYRRYSPHRDVFDALTDGQYGDYNRTKVDNDITRIFTGDD
ncbi:hypothetical protein [Rufibacter aurantiacus]|uniref:hypothetical protein n=1 Tax=Rufibacter aurantiacus TaxID=2817374 RepID=UPI001B30D023|nr:hypothetical protein [Rufibacter aurantiacus]